MATKIECDGCGTDITRTSYEVVEVKWTGSTDRQNGKFDLCRSCAAQMNRGANPSKWARATPAKEA